MLLASWRVFWIIFVFWFLIVDLASWISVVSGTCHPGKDGVCRDVSAECLEGSEKRALNITVGLVSTDQGHMKRMLSLMYGDYNLQQADGRLFPGGREVDGNASCYRILPKLLQFTDTGYSYIHHKNEKRSLLESGAELLVGAYLTSLEGFTASYEKLYIVSTPLPYMFEEYTHRDRALTSRIIATWPSYSMYAHALRLFVDLQLSNQLSDQRVLLLTHAASVDGLNYVSQLESLLGAPAFRKVYTHDIWREVQQMRAEANSLWRSQKYHAIMTKLRNKIRLNKVNMIIVYLEMGLDDKLGAIESLFTKGADLEDADITWVIADMPLPYEEGAMDRLKKLDVLKAKVYLPVVWGNYQFFNKHVLANHGLELLNSGLEGLGVQQISEILEHVVGGVPPSKILNHHDFFQQMDGFIKMSGENTPYSLELLGYPRDVIISFSQIAPFAPDPNTNYSAVGAIRAVFGRPASLVKIAPPPEENLAPTELTNFTIADYQIIGIRPTPARRPRAVVVLDRPFAHVRPDGTFEGLVIDIFNDIDKILMAEGLVMGLELRGVEGYGKKYGHTWSDALGELQNDVDTVLALGQFSSTPERRQDFKFATPFGYIGFTYIVQKSINFNTFLQFTKPFTSGVWVCLCLVMLLSALHIYLIDTWNPWNNDFENKFTAKESIWYSYLTVSQAGAPFGAYSIPARTFSVFYWFFALVVVGCYTGNLASFLTESILVRPVIDLNYLASSEYRFGYLENSSVAAHFEERLRLDQTDLLGERVRTYKEGMDRVRNGSFVLLGTSTVLKWYENNDPDCSLSMHQTPFYTRGIHEISFVMDPGWEHGQALSKAMQLIRETGRLQRIYHRWVDFAGECHQVEEDEEQVSLSFYHFQGLMVLLAVAIITSFICLAVKLSHIKLRDKVDMKLVWPWVVPCMEYVNRDEGGSTPPSPAPEAIPLKNAPTNNDLNSNNDQSTTDIV